MIFLVTGVESRSVSFTSVVPSIVPGLAPVIVPGPSTAVISGDLPLRSNLGLGTGRGPLLPHFPSTQTLLDPHLQGSDPHLQGSDPHMEGSGPSKPYGFEGPKGCLGQMKTKVVPSPGHLRSESTRGLCRLCFLRTAFGCTDACKPTCWGGICTSKTH